MTHLQGLGILWALFAESASSLMSRLLVTVLALSNCILIRGQVMAAGRLDTLVVAVDSLPPVDDPRLILYNANGLSFGHLLFLPLFESGADGQPQGIVAERFQSLDSKTFVVKVRDGIRFANGRNINADDVVATYQMLVGQERRRMRGARGLPKLAHITAVSKAGAGEVKFTLDEPDTSLASNLTFGILPKESLTLARDLQFIGRGFESGPFVLESSSENQWVIRRNEKYTGAPFAGPLPVITRVVFKSFPDSKSRHTALLRGDADIAQNNLDSSAVAEFLEKRGFSHNVHLATSNATVFMGFNLKDKFLSDVRVRRAISLGINRQEVLKFTLQGMGRPAESMFPPESSLHITNDKVINFSAVESRALLDAAGYPEREGSNGVREGADLTVKVLLNREDIAIAKAVAGQLKRVGVKVRVEILEEKIFSKHLHEGRVQAWISRWTGLYDGSFLDSVYNSARKPPSGLNYGSYSNPQVDSLLHRAAVEFLPDERRRLYLDAQGLVSSDLPYALLWHPLSHSVTRREVLDYKLFSDGRYSSLASARKRK